MGYLSNGRQNQFLLVNEALKRRTTPDDTGPWQPGTLEHDASMARLTDMGAYASPLPAKAYSGEDKDTLADYHSKVGLRNGHNR